MKINSKNKFTFYGLIIFFLTGICFTGYGLKIRSDYINKLSKIKKQDSISREISVIKPIIKKIKIKRGHFWLILPGDYKQGKDYPVIIYLHGRKYDPPNVDRARLHLIHKWLKNITVLRSIVALPMLPRTSYPTWTMRDNAYLKTTIDVVVNRFATKDSKIFLSGFSAGALHSIYVTLNGFIKADGVCAFAYGLAQDIRTIKHLVKDLPIFLAVGKNDRFTRMNVLYSYRMLKKFHFKDLTYREYSIGHWVHDDFIVDMEKWVFSKSKS